MTLNIEDAAVTANATNADIQALFSVRAKNLSLNVSGDSDLTYEGNSRAFIYTTGFGATDVAMAISGGTFAIDDSFTEDMLKAYLVDGATAGALEDGTITVTPAHKCPSAGFVDVDQNAWYHGPVDFVVENGIITGVAGKYLAPADIAQRAQVAAVIARLDALANA